MFPLWLIEFLVIGSLVLSGIGIVVLVLLIAMDLRNKELW
jgi:hypothetical protein